MPSDVLDTPDSAYELISAKSGPTGKLPLTDDLLRHAPSGDLFGWSQNVGMGWNPTLLGGQEFTILSTHGGLRAEDGTPIALGFHSGHWEVGLLVKAAAEELAKLRCIPFAGAVTDPCDGRTQGTAGMYDSLPYRNDSSQVMRRLDAKPPDACGRHGRGDVRQGTARDDDGAGVAARQADDSGARRRDARGQHRRRRHGEGADHRGTLRPRRDHARTGRGSGVPCVCVARRRLSVPRHRGHVAGGRRSARA